MASIRELRQMEKNAEASFNRYAEMDPTLIVTPSTHDAGFLDDEKDYEGIDLTRRPGETSYQYEARIEAAQMAIPGLAARRRLKTQQIDRDLLNNLNQLTQSAVLSQAIINGNDLTFQDKSYLISSWPEFSRLLKLQMPKGMTVKAFNKFASDYLYKVANDDEAAINNLFADDDAAAADENQVVVKKGPGEDVLRQAIYTIHLNNGDVLVLVPKGKKQSKELKPDNCVVIHNDKVIGRLTTELKDELNIMAILVHSLVELKAEMIRQYKVDQFPDVDEHFNVPPNLNMVAHINLPKDLKLILNRNPNEFELSPATTSLYFLYPKDGSITIPQDNFSQKLKNDLKAKGYNSHTSGELKIEMLAKMKK